MDEPTCKVDGCAAPIKVKKWQLCKTHYSRFVSHGDPLAWKRKPRSVCSVEGCGVKVAANGLCDKHYRRQRRYGSTNRPARPTVCAIDGCGRPVQAWAFCERHYRQAKAGTLSRRCQYCGQPIPQERHAASPYCSDACREKVMYERRRADYRENWLVRNYGLTVDQYDRRLAEQGGVCAVCGSDKPNGRKGSPYFQVDHDHATGEVRGLLCSGCNTGIGLLRDDPAILRAAIAYLEQAVT